MRVAIIGGGIAGLSAAWSLSEQAREGKDVSVTLFEKQARLGGKILSRRTGDGFLLEGGPDSFVASKKGAQRIIEALSLDDRLLPTRSEGGRIFVYHAGRLHPLPEGLVLMVPSRISSLFGSTLLSFPGKLRMMADLFIPPRPEGLPEESLEQFVTRRLGREALDLIAEPLISGIHSATPKTMSVRASFPRFLDMERAHGSLMRAALSARHRRPSVPSSRPRRTHFMSFKDGMAELVEAVAKAIPAVDIRLSTPVTRLEQDGGSFRVSHGDQGPGLFDGVLVAAPPPAAASLLKPVAAEASDMLSNITMLGAATYTAVWSKSDFPKPLAGHGFVVPAVDGRRIMGVTYLSEKWAGRAPDDNLVLLRAFIGGPQHQELVLKDDEELARVAREELSDMLGLTRRPLDQWIFRWPEAMPQYTLGHIERVDDLFAALPDHPPLRLAGAAYRGIGIPDCIQSGLDAASSLWEQLAR